MHYKTLRTLAIAGISLLSSFVFSQNCGCDHLIQQAGIYRPASLGSGPFYLNAQPGDVICVKAGIYADLRFFDFQGSEAEPITVVNCGGQAVIANNSYAGGLIFENCRYFHVTGTGDDAFEYGLKINGTGAGASGVVVTRLSSDFELDHIEVANSGFAGFMVKTDPGCDPATWQQNYTMQNVDIHHNYIHHTGGEGMYIGSVYWENGMEKTCDSETIRVYPHRILGLQVHENRLENTGADGIQYGCAADAQIYNNSIVNAGTNPFAVYQNSGIQCGGGSGGTCFNNTIKNPGGCGIIVLGHLGGNKFYNNLIVGTGGYGIFADDANSTQMGSKFEILNNTIVNPATDGIRLYNQANENIICNNAIVAPVNGQFVAFGQGATAATSHNYTAEQLENAGFYDWLDFKPSPSSPLVDNGDDTQPAGVDLDIQNQQRPINGRADIGAYEFQSIFPIDQNDLKFSLVNADGRKLFWFLHENEHLENVEIERSLDGINFISVGSIEAEGQGIYSFTDSENLTGKIFYRLKLKEGEYSFDHSATLSCKVEHPQNKPRDSFGQVLELLAGQSEKEAHVEIYDMAGRAVATFSANTMDGSQGIADRLQVPAGVYVVHVKGEGFDLSQKVFYTPVY